MPERIIFASYKNDFLRRSVHFFSAEGHVVLCIWRQVSLDINDEQDDKHRFLEKEDNLKISNKQYDFLRDQLKRGS